MSDWFEDYSEDLPIGDKLKRKAETLKTLKKHMLDAEAAFNEATKQYNTACLSMAEEFRMNGIATIVDDTGVAYTVVAKTTCNITKERKREIAEWLRNIGFTKIDEELRVIGTEVNKRLLQQVGVAFEQECDMNTNSVKAFLLGALGQKESPAIITKDDIPKGLNFYQYETVEIKS